MRLIGALTLAIVLGAAATAADRAARDTFIPLSPQDSSDAEGVVIPVNSPVKFKNFDRNEPAAHFEGEFLLTGRWEIYSDDEHETDPFLVPDPSVAKTLTHWRLRGGPESIGFKNEEKFIAAVVPEQVWSDLKHKKIHQAGGRIAIWVKNYDISIVCDAPEYDVDFVRVAQPAEIAMNLQLKDAGCL
jgi:hypothetical protein